MWHRIVRHAAGELSDVEVLLDDIGDQVTLILDVDGTVARQGAPPDEFERAVNSAIDDLEGHPRVDRAIALTNGAERGVPRMVSRGNKPWTTRRRLGIGRSDQVVVVGDQVMTDGVLAWRLGGVFIHLVIDDREEPLAQQRMRRRGRWFGPLLFKTPEGN